MKVDLTQCSVTSKTPVQKIEVLVKTAPLYYTFPVDDLALPSHYM